MKKTIIAICAAAFLGGVTAPTPASAFVWVVLPLVLEAKKDKNWDAKQAQAKKVATKKSKKKRT